jgi:hypothetical protein
MSYYELFPLDLKKELWKYEHKMYFSQVLEECTNKTQWIKRELDDQSADQQELIELGVLSIYCMAYTANGYVYPTWVLDTYRQDCSINCVDLRNILRRKVRRITMFIWLDWSTADITKETLP